MDGANHWHDCVCGEKGNLSNHVYGGWTIVKEATETEAGERTRSCVCGHTIKDRISPTGNSDPDNTPEENTGSGNGSDNTGSGEPQKKKGCSSSVAAYSALPLVLFVAAVIRKRRSK